MAEDEIPVRIRRRPGADAAPKRALRLDETAAADAPVPEGAPDPFDIERVEGFEGGALPGDLAGRTRYIGRYNRDYTREFVLSTLHELLLSRAPMDQIAQKFGVSVRSVYKWKAELKEAMAEEARTLNPYPLLGETLNHFKAIRAAAWRLYQSPTAKAHEKARALEVALNTQTAAMKTLKEWGYLSTVTIAAPQTAEATSEGAAAAKLADSIRNILNGAWDIAGDVEGEPVELDAGDGEGAA